MRKIFSFIALLGLVPAVYAQVPGAARRAALHSRSRAARDSSDLRNCEYKASPVTSVRPKLIDGDGSGSLGASLN